MFPLVIHRDANPSRQQLRMFNSRENIEGITGTAGIQGPIRHCLYHTVFLTTREEQGSTSSTQGIRIRHSLTLLASSKAMLKQRSQTPTPTTTLRHSSHCVFQSMNHLYIHLQSVYRIRGVGFFFVMPLIYTPPPILEISSFLPKTGKEPV